MTYWQVFNASIPAMATGTHVPYDKSYINFHRPTEFTDVGFSSYTWEGWYWLTETEYTWPGSWYYHGGPLVAKCSPPGGGGTWGDEAGWRLGYTVCQVDAGLGCTSETAGAVMLTGRGMFRRWSGGQYTGFWVTAVGGCRNSLHHYPYTYPLIPPENILNQWSHIAFTAKTTMQWGKVRGMTYKIWLNGTLVCQSSYFEDYTDGWTDAEFDLTGGFQLALYPDYDYTRIKHGWCRLSDSDLYGSTPFDPPARTPPPEGGGGDIGLWHVDEGSGNIAHIEPPGPIDGTIIWPYWVGTDLYLNL